MPEPKNRFDPASRTSAQFAAKRSPSPGASNFISSRRIVNSPTHVALGSADSKLPRL